MGTWLVSEKIQKKTKRKQRLSLELGATKPIDHIRARMVSRLAEIKAEVMCCMSTTADTLNHQDPLFQGHGSWQTSRTPIGQVSTDGGVRPILSTPGPARGFWFRRRYILRFLAYMWAWRHLVHVTRTI